jgi:RNA polymerase sigma-70 factor (ECF subfamily)
MAAEQVFKNLHRFDQRSEVGTWVYGVCYRVLLNQRRWFRRWKVRFTPQELTDDAPDAAPTPAELFEARVRARRLHHALAKMTEKYRTVVVLHDLEELEVSEIAKVVACGELTVRSRLRDGRKQLTKLLEAAVDNESLGARHELAP